VGLAGVLSHAASNTMVITAITGRTDLRVRNTPFMVLFPPNYMVASYGARNMALLHYANEQLMGRRPAADYRQVY
jgi:hypothetical protein